ncbi:DegV family protein [Actinopolymorpha alba]|uniref:DegV family protein n=1 Tax=Actinopolymorpha alba TaxID=533267 RepID=UPI0003768831|nr:DegV family protein [Actinopolymorpha alba]
MGPRVALVTDSTAYLAAEEAAAYSISVVPLRVVVGDTTYAEGPPSVTRLVSEALRVGERVTTSRPSPLDFLEVYRAAADAGTRAVVSVHLSGELSGTRDAARLGALQAPLPVTVVDSRQVGMGLGFAVLAAAGARDRGAAADEVAETARRRAARTRTLLYVDTLEHLRKGGRIGAPQAVLGSALAVKPILHLVDGRLSLLAKVHTAGRALAELERRTVAYAGDQDVEVAVHHLGNPGRAEELATRLRDRIPRLAGSVVREAGSVIGAHVGPGMIAVVVSPLEAGVQRVTGE